MSISKMDRWIIETQSFQRMAGIEVSSVEELRKDYKAKSRSTCNSQTASLQNSTTSYRESQSK